MNIWSKYACINLFILSTSATFADDVSQYGSQQTATNTQNLVDYLVNLGGYLGYDIKNSPTNSNNQISPGLLNPSATQILQTYMYSTFLGALLVNTANQNTAQFLPNQVTGASNINGLANSVFRLENYNNASSQQQGKISVNNNIDQQTFQQDPVGQEILNVLTTPDSSYCMNSDKSQWLPNCVQSNGNAAYLSGNSVTANIIGTLPSTNTYFTYQYNQQLLTQLNSNSLTSPLMYSIENGSSNNTSSSQNNSNSGLAAQTQAQQAASFIKYASGGVTPVQMPDRDAYDKIYVQATTSTGSNSSPSVQQIKAQSILSSYFTGLRTYVAQYSVGLSNLYYIMSKRLPQNPTGNANTGQVSQALSEFKLATWRLFNTEDMSTNNQWINKINNASPATVEKEIATLLAEINYQMYLDRQIQERILLTNSIMLIQNTRQTQPSASFSGEPGSSPLQ